MFSGEHSNRYVLLSIFITSVLLTVTNRLSAVDSLPPQERADCRRVFFPLPELPAGDPARSAEWLEKCVQAVDAGDFALAFDQLWLAHHADPSNQRVRRALTLPKHKSVRIQFRKGTGAPTVLGWRRGNYLNAESRHFVVHSNAQRDATIRFAQDLERLYWVWAQVFFPLWEGRTDIRRAITQGKGIATGNRRMRVVLCDNRDTYVRALAPSIPGIERSTGFYSDSMRTTFLFVQQPDDPATRYHELTHQLLREATGSQLRASVMPGEHKDFWLIEGIASYMESFRFAPTYGLIGGWESPRLQFARYRWLITHDTMPLAELSAEGRIQAQRRNDLSQWYSHAAAYTHLLIDGNTAGGKDAVLAKLLQMYRIPTKRNDSLAGKDIAIEPDTAFSTMRDFLRISDSQIGCLDPKILIHSLCLGRTLVTAKGLAKIPPQPHLRWLDLSHLDIRSADVHRLVARSHSLQQLNLEGTAIDTSLADVLSKTKQLKELDLSSTAISDSVILSLPNTLPLETLWLTQTNVTDQICKKISRFTKLRSLDVQRTQITQQALDHLERQHPKLTINPLELTPPP